MFDNPFLSQLLSSWHPLAVMASTLLLAVCIKLLAPKKRRWRQKTAKRVLIRLQALDSTPQKIAYLRNPARVDPFVFEELILEAFERRGCRVKRNERYTGDGGIDGKFWINKQLYLVQAKRYSGHINAAHVREFVALIEQHRCKGIFVHTGRTGKMAREIAKQHPDVTIISGERLIQLVTPKRNPIEATTPPNAATKMQNDLETLG
ncbi:restriction endonuclease [Halomonas sp. 3A7M]|uniref:restriction endonuclease n=1 Tax=Halomonas sp. 3A7M TaxID=2742616 RepID=UPI001868164E|nr:restriction endonuclease [Halomonas sp. 3A7M]